MSLLITSPVFADSLNLMWDPNTDPVSGYAVYVGTTSGTYTQRFDVGPATGFTYSTATAGQMYCFTVAAYTAVGESPKSGEVCGYSNRYPVITNPGNQTSTVGQSISLQLVASDPDGQALTFSATGLPAGLVLGANTGFISGSGTTAGTFSVTARASDGVLSSSQAFTWTMNSAAPAPDTTAPVVTIGSPTSSSTYSTTTSSISLSGTGTDNVGVTQVSWANSLGGSGLATGTSSWSTGAITLASGSNVITVTARDAAGNVGSGVITVSYTAPAPAPAPAPSVVLSAQLTPLKFRQSVSLTWTNAPWSSVYVYRNGSRLTKTTNDGSYTDNLRTSGTYSYKICQPGTNVCSNTVTVFY